jgi:hypothetical protein
LRLLGHDFEVQPALETPDGTKRLATFGVRSADAQEGPPVGGCPESYDPGLVPVEVVLRGAGLEEPDPSMDPNEDGYTCLKLIDTGQGTRATWHDNVIKEP